MKIFFHPLLWVKNKKIYYEQLFFPRLIMEYQNEKKILKTANEFLTIWTRFCQLWGIRCDSIDLWLLSGQLHVALTEVNFLNYISFVLITLHSRGLLKCNFFVLRKVYRAWCLIKFWVALTCHQVEKKSQTLSKNVILTSKREKGTSSTYDQSSTEREINSKYSDDQPG